MKNIIKTGIIFMAISLVSCTFADIQDFLKVNEEPFRQKIENAASEMVHHPLIEHEDDDLADDQLSLLANIYLEELKTGIYKEKWIKNYIQLARKEFPDKTMQEITKEAENAWDVQYQKAIKYMADKLLLDVKK